LKEDDFKIVYNAHKNNLMIFGKQFVTFYNRSEDEEVGEFGLGGTRFDIDYDLQMDRLYIGTSYKEQGKIRIYSISSSMADKFYEIKVPTTKKFRAYPHS
jgi:hypothetical protein